MSVVWKLSMTPTLGGGQVFDLPQGAVFRHCAVQGSAIALWLEVPDTSAPAVQRWFRAFGTGQAIDERDLVYLGTVLFDDGQFVLHVYEQPMPGGAS